MHRTAVGLLIIATLTNFFDSMSIDSSVQLVVKGAVVLAAVAADARRR